MKDNLSIIELQPGDLFTTTYNQSSIRLLLWRSDENYGYVYCDGGNTLYVRSMFHANILGPIWTRV